MCNMVRRLQRKKNASAELLAEILKQRELNIRQEEAIALLKNRMIKQEKEMKEFRLRL